MSEIRSQATPARDELVHILAGAVLDNPGGIGTLPQHAADRLLAAGWSKPRTVNSADELDALPEDTVIRVQKRKGAKFATYYEKIHRNMWLALDPGDRSDGEDSWDAQVIVRFNEAITVLFTPGDAE